MRPLTWHARHLPDGVLPVATLVNVSVMADSTAEVFSSAKFTQHADRSGLTGRELAARLGVTPAQVSALRSGRRAPSMERLKRIVEVLGGTAGDYLQLPDKQRWNLRHYRLAAGLTQLEVSQQLSVAPAAVSGWEARRYRPPRVLLPQLAQLYNATEKDLDNAVGYAKIVSSSEGLIALAQSVIGVVEVALRASASLDADASQKLTSSVRDHLETSLEALSGALRGLPDGPDRAAVIEAIRHMAELYATSNT